MFNIVIPYQCKILGNIVVTYTLAGQQIMQLYFYIDSSFQKSNLQCQVVAIASLNFDH